ncbi:vitamin B12-dependent ribonucleotide reductase [Candidatus Magnetomonas plexicatena]|uniref:vitamin B12-dependent ribonucleotide reductase n=1 Tax=Candidatus Magnetomonas plexicatena TaxID=2552947 RepID=UPI004032EE33
METTEEMTLTQNALKVLQKRYLKKGENGEPVETPHDMFTRVAHAIASNDLNYGKSFSDMEQLEREFYEMMADMAFLPNSPTLMNAGRRLGQLSACFVIPVEDSMESIFEAVKNAALIHKSGGGTGFSFSRLRPSGDVVGSTKGVSSGPISFMTVFDTATEAVKQGGTRRGANMAILRVDHPDIIDFITCKENSHRLNNFNISVGLTEKFMNSVSEDGEYELLNPRSGKAVKTVSAGYVFDLIVKHAWQNGEPGIVFLDRINETNPTPHLGLIESTNPCGEQPLLPFESCNLGSLNLSRMLKKLPSGTMEIDYNRIKDITHKAVHFLDNVIDLNKYPLKKIEEMTKGNRKIGLGVMGWADMLTQLGIPYNSEEALTAAESVMKHIRDEGRNASEALAEGRGVFPNFEGSIHDGKRKQRNATITTIAPTGTLSIIAGCSSGIEPIFAVSYVKTVMDGTRLYEVNSWFEKVSKERGFYSLDLMEDISLRPSILDVSDIPADVRKVFVTAHDISPEYHIKMQGAFQKYVDNAVSKTVNFSSSATTDDVKKAYMQAFKLGCKGVTVYRDGSREGQVLSTSSHHEPTSALSAAVIDTPHHKLTPRKRPKLIKGSTESILTGCGNLYVTINEDENGLPFEVFNHIGKAGGCASSQSEAIGRLVSLALRCNIAPDELITQLKGISCHQPIWANGGKISSCADAIAKAVENYCSHSKNSDDKPKSGVNMSMGACPECGGVVEHESGCAVCHDCGYTKCM